MSLRLLTRACAVVAFVAALSPSAADAQKAVFVVRHAERQDESPDSPLSAAGKVRAERLAAILADAGVTAIYATQWQRTRQTVAPLATAAKVEITQIDSKDLTGLVAAIRARSANDVVVVAAHSDSAPKIVAALGGSHDIAIARDEYDNLFVIVPGAGTTPTFLRLRY
jgi:phosphohistidine phosphatase SixA